MLRLPPFRLHTPTDLDEALAIVRSEGPGCRLVAGGTDLWPNMKRRHQAATSVVSLQSIPQLKQIGTTAEGLSIGAMVTLDTVASDPTVLSQYPALATAAASVSSPPLRNMGTLGGNLCLDTRCTYYNQTEEWRRSIDYCMKESGEVCWVAPGSSRCWAHSASDTAPLLCALEAQVEIVSSDGVRTQPLEALYNDDGIDYLTLGPGEILTRVLVPNGSNHEHCRSSFWKLRRRGSIDFAVLSVAAALWLDDEHRVETARVFLGAVASHPLSATDAAASLEGHALNRETIDRAARLARKPATPMDNTDFQAQWRGVMVERYVEAALGEAAGLEPERLSPGHPIFSHS